MFRRMLNAHPRIHCGPEFKIPHLLGEWVLHNLGFIQMGLEENDTSFKEFLPFLGASVEMFLNHQAEMRGKNRVAEKTPQNAMVMPLLRLMYPKSPMLSIVRNPYEVVASLSEKRWCDQNGNLIDRLRSTESMAQWWVDSVESARTAEAFEVFYEDLIDETEETLKGVCEYIGEPYDSKMLKWYESQEIEPGDSHGEEIHRPPARQAPKELTDEQRRIVTETCGDWIERCGYVPDGSVCERREEVAG